MGKANAIIPVERIQKCILLIRNHKVILDRDLATLYGVETRDLIKRWLEILSVFLKILCFN
jgi:hypothetical protein